jgi:hypothetical protein
MVRRGSTVRVRQRAFGLSLLSAGSRCLRGRDSLASVSTERPRTSTVWSRPIWVRASRSRIACSRPRLGLRAPESALAKGAADVGDVRLAVDVALFQGDPLARTETGGGGEDHHRPEASAESARDRVELSPGFERAFLGAPSLRVLDTLLGGIEIEHSPDDRSRPAPQRLEGSLECRPRIIFAGEAAPLHPPRPTTANPISVSPKWLLVGTTVEPEHLTLLKHQRPLLPSNELLSDPRIAAARSQAKPRGHRPEATEGRSRGPQSL